MSFDRPPYTHTITMAALLFLFWVFIPCAHTFAGVCGCSCQMRSAYQIERSRSLSPMVQSARSSRVSLERSQRGWHPRKRSRGILMGTEEVEDFEVDVELDTDGLDIFGTIITQVKMEGRVPASSHLVYDCSHGEWLLAQMAYDRKIRYFSSKSVKQLGTIAPLLPDNSRFIFSGALIPKQVKRLVKTKGVSAVVVRDVEGPVALSEALYEERDLLSDKVLSKVSQSRERFLLERGGDDRRANQEGPMATVAEGLHVFMRIEKGQQAPEVVETILEINKRCGNLSVVGLWGGDLKEDACLQLLEEVRAKSGITDLRVALDHKGPSSAKWFKDLSSKRRGPIMWTFEYDL